MEYRYTPAEFVLGLPADGKYYGMSSHVYPAVSNPTMKQPVPENHDLPVMLSLVADRHIMVT